MKKLLLVMVAAVGFTSAFAQSQSVVFTGNRITANKLEPATESFAGIKAMKGKNTASKGTSLTADWFDYLSITNTNTTKGYYSVIYPDSNISYAGNSGTSHSFIHGMGISFDPTDSVFKGGDKDGLTSGGNIAVADFDALPEFAVYRDKPYTIDSIAFPMRYWKKASSMTGDSLILSVVKTGDATLQGIYQLSFSNLTDVTPDGKASFSTAMYDAATSKLSDSITPANIIRMAFELAPLVADTNANGLLNKFLNGVAIPGGLSVPAGETVVAYASFVSGTAYPLNTDVNSANTLRGFSYDIAGLNGSPRQSVGSSHCGLISSNQNKYAKSGSDFKYQGHNVLIPSVAYTTDGYNSAWALHVVCPTGVPLAVRNVNSNVTSATAYPNPATSDVTVKFALQQAANTTVSIANTIGQVLSTQNLGNVANGTATFSTANLANGLYFYTVEANGQRTTKRFVVAH